MCIRLNYINLTDVDPPMLTKKNINENNENNKADNINSINASTNENHSHDNIKSE